MSEKDVVESTKYPSTEESLLVDFRSLGIEPGQIVLVHSSLSKIGWVCGAEKAVIEALLQAVGENGTVCMPAHSGDNSDPAKWSNPPVPQQWNAIIYQSMPAFDPHKTPTRGMGRIAELFRTFPGTLRSDHPQVSFCANGKYAAAITENHALTPQFGMDSPLGALYRLKAKILLLGVGYNKCTCLHLSETLDPAMPIMKTGAAITQNGIRKWVWFNDYDYNTDDFEALGRAFEYQNAVKSGKVGSASCKLFDMSAAVDFAREWMTFNRYFSFRR